MGLLHRYLLLSCIRQSAMPSRVTSLTDWLIYRHTLLTSSGCELGIDTKISPSSLVITKFCSKKVKGCWFPTGEAGVPSSYRICECPRAGFPDVQITTPQKSIMELKMIHGRYSLLRDVWMVRTGACFHLLKLVAVL